MKSPFLLIAPLANYFSKLTRTVPCNYLNNLNLIFIQGLTNCSFKDFLSAIPPLIKGYIRLGAFIGDGAVIDYDFNSCFTEYTFGQKWDKWWETTFKDSLSSTDDDSHIFIKTFFMKNVYPYRYEASDVIKF